MRVCWWGGVGFHTMFLLVLVSVFLYLAALRTFVYVCVVRPFGALLCIINILVRHTIVSPWFVAIPYSESLCVFVGGAGWGFIPWFSPRAAVSRVGTWRPNSVLVSTSTHILLDIL